MDQIPDEIWREIFQKCDISTIGTIAQTCHSFAAATRDDFLWHSLSIRDFTPTVTKDSALPKSTTTWLELYKNNYRLRLAETPYSYMQQYSLSFNNTTMQVSVAGTLYPFRYLPNKMPVMAIMDCHSPYYFADLGWFPNSPFMSWSRARRPILIVSDVKLSSAYVGTLDKADRALAIQFAKETDVVEQLLAMQVELGLNLGTSKVIDT
eukprot:TRINITY_DN12048_c0_g1_i1.p1 TRINITY_DN12048_c0_g1~~TRINITY_DN12048_c0_g1_i1.p1  ORF type:complete len:208 (-),score=30.37 TRINITY_DN12048_c0_g1_i1:144-767(-)